MFYGTCHRGFQFLSAQFEMPSGFGPRFDNTSTPYESERPDLVMNRKFPGIFFVMSLLHYPPFSFTAGCRVKSSYGALRSN